MFIVIEAFGGAEYAIVVTDTEGNNKVFTTRKAAQIEADDCQDGRVIKL
jgi:hypothetical protein